MDKLQKQLQKEFTDQFGKLKYLEGNSAHTLEEVTSHYRFHVFTHCEDDTIIASFSPSVAVGYYITTLPNYEENLTFKRNV